MGGGGGGGGGGSTGAGTRRFGTVDDIRSRMFPYLLHDANV